MQQNLTAPLFAIQPISYMFIFLKRLSGNKKAQRALYGWSMAFDNPYARPTVICIAIHIHTGGTLHKDSI